MKGGEGQKVEDLEGCWCG